MEKPFQLSRITLRNDLYLATAVTYRACNTKPVGSAADMGAKADTLYTATETQAAAGEHVVVVAMDHLATKIA